MRTIDKFLMQYGESHQNSFNKLVHWICVPAIVFSLAGIIYSIPFPLVEKSVYLNWASLVFFLALIYYLRLSIPLAFGFLFVAIAVVLGNHMLHAVHSSTLSFFYTQLIIFALAWVGQFIGHKIEGKKPSFLQDIQFLLIGPAWLLHFIYKKIGIQY